MGDRSSRVPFTENFIEYGGVRRDRSVLPKK
jgi:hypothetical protein